MKREAQPNRSSGSEHDPSKQSLATRSLGVGVRPLHSRPSLSPGSRSLLLGRMASALLLICLLSTPSTGLPAAQVAEKLDEFGGLQCEDEMARLDMYAIALQNAPHSLAYVVAYGGRRGTARRELSRRMARIRRYLVNRRGIEAERVRVVAGGFRQSLTIELWLVPQGQAMPQLTPTVPAREVRYRRGRFIVDCSLFY